MLQEGVLYVHRVHNKGGIFDIMLDTPLDIADCRTIKVNYNHCNYVLVRLHMDRKEHRLHRLIVGDIPDGYQVDHIDNHPLNNTRANLRIVTRRQNLLNRTVANKTGFIGASTNGKGFKDAVRVNGKTETIGTYETAEEAGMVRDEVMSLVVGEGYCKFNFAPEDRCISDKQMRQVAEFLNRHQYKL